MADLLQEMPQGGQAGRHVFARNLITDDTDLPRATVYLRQLAGDAAVV
jgi:hypothetical protein